MRRVDRSTKQNCNQSIDDSIKQMVPFETKGEPAKVWCEAAGSALRPARVRLQGCAVAAFNSALKPQAPQRCGMPQRACSALSTADCTRLLSSTRESAWGQREGRNAVGWRERDGKG